MTAGVGVVTLGIGGGPLIVALILGKLRRTGPMLWVMPLPANIRFLWEPSFGNCSGQRIRSATGPTERST